MEIGTYSLAHRNDGRFGPPSSHRQSGHTGFLGGGSIWLKKQARTTTQATGIDLELRCTIPRSRDS